MPAVEAAGAALLTFGPVVTFFLGFVAPRSQLLIMSVLAAFFWVLAISLTGLVWVVIPPLQAYAGFFLPLAVLLQELARWGLAKLHLRAEPFVLSLLPAADPMAWNDLSVALAAGTGFGLVQAVTMHGGAVVGAGGPSGGLPVCGASLWVVSSLQASLEGVAHASLMIVAFDIARRASGATSAAELAEGAGASAEGSPAPGGRSMGAGAAALRWALVVAVHLAWSLPSLASSAVAGGCSIALGCQAAATAVAAVWAVVTARRPTYEPAQRAARAEAIAEAETSRRVGEAQRWREAEARAAARRRRAAAAPAEA